jgi:aminocarboxymuconate-semialdehyde decarboxylase
MNVDVHSHIVDRQYLDNLVSTLALASESTNDGKRLFRKDGSTVAWSRDDMFDIDRRLEDMDKKDISVRILSLSAPNVYLWNGVDHVAAPNVLRGMGLTHLTKNENAKKELAEKGMVAQGV